MGPFDWNKYQPIIVEQDGRRLRAEDVARRWGTINYEVVCGIAARVPRVPS